MGYVYILTNPAMPDLIKIGFTTRTAEDRARELYKDRNGHAVTGVPVPFDVFNSVSCELPRELETLIHNELGEHRVKNPKTDKVEREFFRYPADAAFQKLREIHQREPSHANCVSSDGLWRKWTSQLLTRFKRKATTPGV